MTKESLSELQNIGNMKTKLLLFSILLCFSSCQFTGMINEDKLTDLRTEYKGKEFKTGGCYVHQISDSVCRYYFYYTNGIRLELNDSANIVSVNQFDLEGIYDNILPWAVFSVENKIITTTSWDSNDVGTFFFAYSIGTKEDYFKIENDSTLSTISSDNNIIYYHFQKFTPKPDSINSFIK